MNKVVVNGQQGIVASNNIRIKSPKIIPSTGAVLKPCNTENYFPIMYQHN